MKKGELVKLVIGFLIAAVMSACGFILDDVYASLDKKQDVSTAKAQYEDLTNRINYFHEQSRVDKKELLDAIRDSRR